MATKVIKVTLSKSSIEQARKELKSYESLILEKTRILVERLADVGIEVAENNTGGYGKYIEFTKQVEPTQTGCKALMIARDKQKIISEWVTKEGKQTAEVSPVLMAEYGSGKYAVDGWRGTFPGQTHADNPNGWWYMDTSGKWHHRYGSQPYRPMYTAYQEMLEQIDEIAKEVFNE